MQIFIITQDQLEFFQVNLVSTTVWLQHLDFNKMLGRKKKKKKKKKERKKKELHNRQYPSVATVLNKSWKQHPTKYQLYDQLWTTTQT